MFTASNNGCTGAVTTAITLFDPGSLTFAVAATAPAACGSSGGLLTLTGSGTAGIVANTNYMVSYTKDGVYVAPTLYTTDAARKIFITGLTAGVYNNITVTGTNNCARPASSATLIQDPGSQTFSAAALSTSGCSVADGAINLTGLTTNTTYTISYKYNGSTVGPLNMVSDATGALSITSLSAGNYSSIKVINAAGCTRVLEMVVVTDQLVPDFNAIHFVNENVGYMVGSRGIVMKTVNGGTTWTRLITPFPTQGFSTIITSVFFLDGNTGVFLWYNQKIFQNN